MDDYTIDRILEEAYLYLKNRSTVREISKFVNVSKSTVHKDLAKRLIHIDYSLFERVREQLDYNKQVRHIRGGMSTKRKYLNK